MSSVANPEACQHLTRTFFPKVMIFNSSVSSRKVPLKKGSLKKIFQKHFSRDAFAKYKKILKDTKITSKQTQKEIKRTKNKSAWKMNEYWVLSAPYFPVFGDLRVKSSGKFPYSVRIRESLNRKISVFQHFLDSLRNWSLLALIS